MKKDFVTVTPDSGSNNGSLSVVCDAGDAAASTIISVAGGGITKTVNVSRKKQEDILIFHANTIGSGIGITLSSPNGKNYIICKEDDGAIINNESSSVSQGFVFNEAGDPNKTLNLYTTEIVENLMNFAINFGNMIPVMLPLNNVDTVFDNLVKILNSENPSIDRPNLQIVESINSVPNIGASLQKTNTDNILSFMNKVSAACTRLQKRVHFKYAYNVAYGETAKIVFPFLKTNLDTIVTNYFTYDLYQMDV